jgi:hypothetical protein
MAKSSRSEQARRLNAAVELMHESASVSQAVDALAARYAISRRQAYRYVSEAQAAGDTVPVPEPNVAFTVKLPRHLVRAVRERATAREVPLSEWVARALAAFLAAGEERG